MMKWGLRLLKSRTGFSLVEVMISLGILGGLGVGASQVLQIQAQGTRNSEHHFTMLEIMYDIGNTLLDRTSCQNSLAGALAAVKTIRSWDGGANTARYVVGNTYGRTFKNAAANSTGGNVSITDISLQNFTGGVSGNALLRVTFQRLPILPGNNPVQRQLPVRLITDGGGNVLQCFVEEDAMLAQVCGLFGGSLAVGPPPKCQDLNLFAFASIPLTVNGDFVIDGNANVTGAVTGGNTTVNGAMTSGNDTTITSTTSTNDVFDNVTGNIVEARDGGGTWGQIAGNQLCFGGNCANWPSDVCGSDEVVYRITRVGADWQFNCRKVWPFKKHSCTTNTNTGGTRDCGASAIADSAWWWNPCGKQACWRYAVRCCSLDNSY